MPRFRVALLSGLAIAGLLGCAAPQTERILLSEAPRPALTELASVPFFPQEDYYCGPATLAMVLAWSGLPVTPDDLIGEVYTPGRDGTFAADIVAAARRHGRLALELRDLDTLLAALDEGYPAIVMQNLSLPWFPQWHFAVAIGYDLSGPQLVLRSGTTRRLLTPLDAFERTWERADYWALAVLPPDTALEFTDQETWLTAIAGIERTGRSEDALVAYRTFLTRHSQNAIARIGEANTLLALEDYLGAERSYRRALESNPQMAEAWNNLAYALYFQGRQDDAIAAAETAVAIAGSENRAYADTLNDVSQPRP